MNFKLNNFSFKENGHYVALSICGLISCGLLMTISASKAEAKSLETSLKKKKQALNEAGKTKIVSESLGDIEGTTRAISIARFTGELESLSRNQSVGLSQLSVDSVTRPAPGLPVSNAEWIESDVSFTVQGTTTNIYGFVQGLEKSTAKFRIIEINITPQTVTDREKSPGVSAMVHLALLMKSGVKS